MKKPLKHIMISMAAAVLIGAGCMGPLEHGRQTIDLSGFWRFRIDSLDTGEPGRWFAGVLPGGLRLPGSMQERGFGDPVSLNTRWTGSIVDRSWFTDKKYAPYREPGNIKVPFWLQPERIYAGAAWYQKEVIIPDSWKGKKILLFLERCHWETTLWVDQTPAGIQNSLGAPHEYDLTALLTPGKHRLTLRVDNRIKIDVGINAHSVSDHTQTNWNGIVGALRLVASDPVFIRDIRIIPDAGGKKAELWLSVPNETGRIVHAEIGLSAVFLGKPWRKFRTELSGAELKRGDNQIRMNLSLGENAALWDEFHPGLYRLRAEIRGESFRDIRTETFGLRDFRSTGTRFTINGRPVFLRGTLECCIFPKTGYPAMDVKEWLRIFKVCRAHGLNHMRFHSWCPPEAAFDAADRIGFYLHVECGAWTEVGSGQPFDRWLYEESERIVRAYGNHPSFCMMAYGNEPSGAGQRAFLGEFVRYWQKKDPRRMYTSAAGWPVLPESDYHSTYEPRIQAWGAGLSSIINRQPPQTLFDFREIIGRYGKPVVSHEIGQWCVYPNFREISRYTGVLKAKNFEIFQETLEANHMGHLADPFMKASGKLQALCYKADIEAALRTPGMAGFQLLDLHDFPGQGTALVGVLDAFWGEKGYITPEEFSRFCGPTVPLARMAKMTFTGNETFEADIEAAHFGEAPLAAAAPVWTIHDPKGKIAASGHLPVCDIPVDNCTSLGSIRWPLDQVPVAGRYDLSVRIGRAENGWAFWVYPVQQSEWSGSDVLVTHGMDSVAAERLEQGGRVFLCIPPKRVHPERGGRIGLGFSSIFWNTAWTHNQKPHTLGILCDPAHPALRAFPTEYHSGWQWWEIITKAAPLVLDGFPDGLRPIVKVIDDWFSNRRLALVFEARVGNGTLLAASIDFEGGMADRPTLKELYRSLREYAAGEHFRPSVNMSLEEIRSLIKSPELLDSARVVRCDSEVPGYEATFTIDGDPETFWHTPWEGVVPRYPHEIVIDIGKQALIGGVEMLPRQDGITGGMISLADIEISTDSMSWMKAAGPIRMERGNQAARVVFSKTRTVRYIRLIARKGFEGQEFASLAELKLIAEH